MADKKISQLTAASTPLAGTEVLPIVQSGSTVKVASDDLTVKNVRSNATTGILQVAGPGVGTTRVMTTPDANFTVARTDAAQTFTGDQTFGTVLGTTFDTNVAAAGVTLSGVTLAADGTNADIDINITPKGTGEVNLTKVDIDGGAIDGTAIGATTASTGKFTTVDGTSTFILKSTVNVAQDTLRVFSGANSTTEAAKFPGSASVNGVDGTPNAGGLMLLYRDSGNTRSISAAGSLNANGTDYAEYMVKNGDFVLEKGEIAGVDANAKLTNKFADSVAFLVKSTNPSYVGGDNWFTEQPPNAEDAKALAEWKQRMEAARATVDRMAFAGQVPVNVLGAKPGDYIVPTNDGDKIKGIAVSSPTFEQYKDAVGRVISIGADGRATILVKVA